MSHEDAYTQKSEKSSGVKHTQIFDLDGEEKSFE